MNYLHEKLAPLDTCNLTITHFLNLRGMSSAFDEKTIFKCLPSRLVSKIIWEQNAKDIHSIRLFHYFSHQKHRGIIVYLLQLMTSVTYEDKAYIVEEGIVACELIFLIRGKCDVIKRIPKSASHRFSYTSNADDTQGNDIIIRPNRNVTNQSTNSILSGWRKKSGYSASFGGAGSSILGGGGSGELHFSFISFIITK